jgi:TPR repeat protein
MTVRIHPLWLIGLCWAGTICLAVDQVDLDQLKVDASNGKAVAQTELGLRMIHGDGVEKRPTEGFVILRKAADAGEAEAMALYGALLTADSRRAPTHDRVQQAVVLLERAARAENTTAITTLARIHLSKRFGDIRDEKKGETWLVRGIAAGHPAAARLAGRIYLGAGDKSHPKAKLWFTKSLEFYVRYSNKRLNSNAYSDRIDLRIAKADAAASALALAQMHSAELAGTKKKDAAGWYRTASNLGSIDAMISLAKLHLRNRDTPRAAKMFQRAAEAGNTEGMRHYGDMLRTGHGVDRNATQALHWYEKAIVSGDTYAMVSAARLYHQGDEGLPPNHQLSFRWAAEAATRGVTDGHYLVALHQRDGLGTPVNLKMAFSNFLRPALNGHPLAMLELSHMYRKGLGTEANPAQAYRWARKAAQSGLPQAMSLFGLYLHRGLGVERNDIQAFTWTLKAAQGGETEAMKRVSRFFAEGIGTDKNPEAAKRWTTKVKNRVGE